METIGQTATNAPANDNDPALTEMREALTGHNAKPFIAVNATNGRPIGWYDSEEHAVQAARFASKQGTAHVVYRAIVLVEPVRGNIALLTHVKAPVRESPSVVTA